MQPSSYRYRVSLRGRMAALLLSLAMSVLVIFILVMMGALPPGAKEIVSKLVAVELSRPSSPAPARTRTAAKARRATPVARPPAVVVPQPVRPPAFIKLSRAEFAASDISRLARSPAQAAGNGTAAQAGGAGVGPGEGPGGARLYNAEWYREPTHAELVTYLPPGGLPGDWATIACRTIEKNRVDDCQELDESRPGSGLARALRRAAWQFLIRPPRLEGKPIIGAWVRIRFNFRPAGETGP